MDELAMSSRSRSSRERHKGGHAHCDFCYSRRCRARVEPSVCCPLSTCRLLCGALFHLCKEEDHLLLCPNVRVPCINAEFGCPLQMPRSSRAEHLQFCPASVVSCSMEWNRWPAEDAHSHPNPELHENLMSERVKGACLDLAMALKDQDRLFHSLKMKKLFPELTQQVDKDKEEEKRRKKEKLKKSALTKEAASESTKWQSFNKYNFSVNAIDDDDDDDEKEEEDILEELLEVTSELELTQAEREALAYQQGINPEYLENYNAWERMFNMEMGGCREAGAGPETATGKSLSTLPVEDEANEGCSGAAAGGNQQTSAPAPPAACPIVKKKSFTYERIEPMKIITVRTFKIPTSFEARPSRIRNPWFKRREYKAVDTSDLRVELQDMPVWEEVQATLLCSLEREQRGHMIAESVSTDTLLVDEGTQTYHFLSTPFRSDASLWDLSEAKAPELHLQLQVESVTSRHHKASSAFTFLCGQSFQRREYGLHYKNIHSEIHMCVNGWFEQRCPLAYLGCTYSQRRFRPTTYDATVNYNEELGCFSLRPSSPLSNDSSLDAPITRQSAPQRRKRHTVGGEDPLSSLPYEVLCHVASFLDSLSLSQLALVSRLMREVCSSQLQDKGMVTLHWERRTYSNGKTKWRVTHKIWEFSTFFAPVDSWCFRDVPPLSEHLRLCPHYETEARTERVLLPKIRERRHKDTSRKGPSLVTLFKNNKLIM